VQLALRWGATGQLSGIWLGLWASASGGAAQSASMLIGAAEDGSVKELIVTRVVFHRPPPRCPWAARERRAHEGRGAGHYGGRYCCSCGGHATGRGAGRGAGLLTHTVLVVPRFACVCAARICHADAASRKVFHAVVGDDTCIIVVAVGSRVRFPVVRCGAILGLWGPGRAPPRHANAAVTGAVFVQLALRWGRNWTAQWHLARAMGKRFRGCRAKCPYVDLRRIRRGRPGHPRPF